MWHVGRPLLMFFPLLLFQQVEMNCYFRKSPRSLAVLKRKAQRRMVIMKAIAEGCLCDNNK